MLSGKNRVPVDDGRAYGHDVSEEGLKFNKLDYLTLAHILQDLGGCVLNNEIIKHDFENWFLENGTDYDEEEDYYYDIYQYYIIDDAGAEYLEDHSNEIVYYNENLDMYLWGVTHFVTGWDYVLTDIELVPWAEYFEINK